MTVHPGDLALLQDPVAVELLGSRQPARLAYNWLDGSPRVVPIWFHWTGEQIVLGTPLRAPKLRALRHDPRVAVTIDSTGWPYHVLLVRGDAAVEVLDDVAPEYVEAAKRYFGEEQGLAWGEQMRGQPMARVAITPTWATVLDFETRLPSALAG